MASDDDSDGVLGPPDLVLTSASDSDGVLGPSSSVQPSRPSRAVRRRGPREVPSSGCFSAWLITTQAADTSAVAAAPGPLQGAAAAEDVIVCGLARCEWKLATSEPPEANVVGGPVADEEGSHGAAVGRLLYNVLECWPFAHSHKLDYGVLPAGFTHLDLRTLCGALPLESGVDVEVFLVERDEVFENILVLPQHFSASAMGDLPATVDEFDLSRRLPGNRGCLQLPPPSTIAKFRKVLGISRAKLLQPLQPPVDKYMETLLRLPKRHRGEKVEDWSKKKGPAHLQRQSDPCKVIDALEFATCLKSTKLFQTALDASHRYQNDDSDNEVPRDRSKDQGRSTLDRAKARADVVGMLLERRLFHAEMVEDSIAAITVQSDASPVVGAELQGMVVEFIHRDATVRQSILPGSTLQYGHFDAVSKGIAFLWAVWLICGPLQVYLDHFFLKSVGLPRTLASRCTR